MSAALRFSPAAERDYRRLDGVTKRRIIAVLRDRLTQVPLPANLDVAPVQGHPPWLRVRIGGHRVLCRALDDAELMTFEASRGFYIHRIVDRRDLDRAVRSL